MVRQLLGFLLLFLTINLAAYSQKLTREQYIQKYQLLAISEMSRSGVPASIKMAQACLESANGNSELSLKSNNHFGIKCKTGWTGQKAYANDDELNECFRKYRNVEDSYVDHTNFLIGNPRYNFLFQYNTTDYVSWAKGLKKAGYATNPQYDKLLIDIIEANQLYRLDQKLTYRELSQFEMQKVSTMVNKNLVINPYQSRQVTLHNGIKSVLARKGDTFEILAQEFGLRTWELQKFNEYPDGYQVQPNEIVYLQAKKLKASGMYEYHMVNEGESMHVISQMYGVKMRSLYRKNSLKFGEPIQVGQVLKLQKKNQPERTN